MKASLIWALIERPSWILISSATSAKLSAIVTRNTANTIQPKAMLCDRCTLTGSLMFPASARAIRAPTRGLTDELTRLFSHCHAGSRRGAEERIAADTPNTTAGVGPSRHIARTSATCDEVSSVPLIVDAQAVADEREDEQHRRRGEAAASRRGTTVGQRRRSSRRGAPARRAKKERALLYGGAW